MTPFTIFVLVVTFLYIIYYAVIITIDLNSKPKSEADNSETLDTEGMVAEEDSDDASEETDSETDSGSEEESTTAPATDDVLQYEDQLPENDQQSDEEEQTSIASESDEIPDNPYGLTDEDDQESTAEALTTEDQNPDVSSEEPVDEETPETDVPEDTVDDSQEPELQIFEPEHVNGGLAESINNDNEIIEAESLTPCKPDMLAANVFDIVGITRSFYGSEQSKESTLSEKQPMQNNEESVIMDKI